ncbi:hypothetical protein JF66_02240 [Cryobacterium sp. MLB-32]|uniref:glycosyltransferase family 4 protein n=1 Tax=Cryobacterium sp. MLB-32 TaxID=1529318 RepID=UPI0004E768E4|nr:glycosyltransferase family 4 protein [Cryobacterium sp. MLB-32]KFF60777.1 hypothetical protein JF66_02240 [Cryobacterium sp. MLB-32]
MKIAVLHGSNDSYGASRVLGQEVECLVSLGHEVTIVVPHPGPLANSLAHLGGAVTVIIDPTLSVLRRSRPVDMLRPLSLGPETARADLVVLWTLALAAYIPLLRLRRKRFYVSVHELLPGRAGGLLVRVLLTTGRFPLTACSTATADWLHSQGVARSRLTVMFPIFDPVTATPSPRPHEPATIAVIGRVNGHKGHLEVVQALQGQGPGAPSWRLLLFGAPFPGQEEALTEVLTAAAGDSRIQYRGEASSLAAIADDIDAVLCFPTRPEPFGLVPIEAWRLGLRSVGYADGGAADVLDIVGGIGVPRTNDTGADVRAALLSLDRAIRQDDELAPPTRVNPFFSSDGRLELLRTVIHTAISRSRVPSPAARDLD